MIANAELIAEARALDAVIAAEYNLHLQLMRVSRDQERALSLLSQLADALEAAEAELIGLREIATSGPSTASGPSPLSHRAAPMEDVRPSK